MTTSTLKNGIQTFWIGKRKFCVHVQTIFGSNYQSVMIQEERQLQGIVWDGTKQWFSNVSKDMKQQAINQYKLLTTCNI